MPKAQVVDFSYHELNFPALPPHLEIVEPVKKQPQFIGVDELPNVAEIERKYYDRMELHVRDAGGDIVHTEYLYLKTTQLAEACNAVDATIYYSTLTLRKERDTALREISELQEKLQLASVRIDRQNTELSELRSWWVYRLYTAVANKLQTLKWRIGLFWDRYFR